MAIFRVAGDRIVEKRGLTDHFGMFEQLDLRLTPQPKDKSVASLNSPLHVRGTFSQPKVGVDVKRLGLMVVGGQPKTTAEYIQATSRVGRHRPGLVCTVYNWARPRDLSHFERFEHYHATFYGHVESLSVTPFAARALDRALSALLVSLVRLPGTEYNENHQAGAVVRQHEYVRRAIDAIATRAAAVTVEKELGSRVRDELGKRLDTWLARAAKAGGGR